MTKNVLVLGAGMVSRPMIKYLFDETDFTVTMASRTVSKAEKIIDGNSKGKSIELNVKDDALLEKYLAVICLLFSLK